MDYRIVFIGMGQYTIGCIEHVLQKYQVVGIIQSIRKKEKYSLLDLISIKHGKLQKLAKSRDIPFTYTDDLNGSKIISFLKQTECNMICVASAGQLLKGEILNIPKYGILNAHSALLPNYRGAHPTYWTFRNQEKKGGVTIHFIDKGMDTGNYLVQRDFDIPYKTSLSEYNRIISEVAGESYLEALNGLTNGTVSPKPQIGTGNCIARRTTAKDYVLDFEKLTTKESFHFLHGTDGINKIHQSTLFDYSIGEPRDGKTKNKLDIICKDGYIPVYRTFNPKSFIFKFVGGILKHIPIKKLD